MGEIAGIEPLAQVKRLGSPIEKAGNTRGINWDAYADADVQTQEIAAQTDIVGEMYGSKIHEADIPDLVDPQGLGGCNQPLHEDGGRSQPPRQTGGHSHLPQGVGNSPQGGWRTLRQAELQEGLRVRTGPSYPQRCLRGCKATILDYSLATDPDSHEDKDSPDRGELVFDVGMRVIFRDYEHVEVWDHDLETDVGSGARCC